MTPRRLTIKRYEQVQKWTADYAEALVRTNLAVRCWLSRGGEPRDRSHRGGPPAHLVLSWLVRNHIVQAFYRSYGVDVTPGAVDAGDGTWVVQTAPGCTGKEPAHLARIAVSAARVYPHITGAPAFDVLQPVIQGEDPLWVIDAAAIHAVGGRWPRHCHRRSCPHRRDAQAYLSVSQIIALLLCMGQAVGAGWGPEDTCDVRLANGQHLRFHVRSGDLHTSGTSIPFSHWCGGDIDRGVSYVCRVGQAVL